MRKRTSPNRDFMSGFKESDLLYQETYDRKQDTTDNCWWQPSFRSEPATICLLEDHGHYIAA